MPNILLKLTRSSFYRGRQPGKIFIPVEGMKRILLLKMQLQIGTHNSKITPMKQAEVAMQRQLVTLLK